MTIKQVIDTLKKMGFSVKFYVRKDGGVRITNINGQSFSGSTGNIVGRNIVGTKLSEAREKQLKKIKSPKGKYDKRRRSKLDDEIVKRIRRLQRKYRKDKTKGQPTQRNYRWVLEHIGKEEADRLLRQSELYIAGLAYEENINVLIARIKSNAEKIDISKEGVQVLADIEKLLERLENMKGVLKEKTLSNILDTNGSLYHWEMGAITTQEFVRQINAELDKN